MSEIIVILYLLAWAVLLLLVIVLSIFLIEVVAGSVPMRDPQLAASVTRAVVLIPAHNEATTIGASLSVLQACIPNDIAVLVVADNCTDATAAIARAAGFDVVERKDPQNRGKGFALAFGREVLDKSPPSCVIVLDADCQPRPGTLAALRDAVAAWNVPVQATNLLRPDKLAPPMVQISNFAFLVKNLVRQRGASRVGRVAILGGTGMAVPWEIFATAPLATSDLVEDLSLGIYATRAGRPPRFLERARVESSAADSSVALTQRTRWEHGFVGTAIKHALPLMVEGVRARQLSCFWMGCHLCVPPLAMLMLIAVAALCAFIALGRLGGTWGPVIVLGALLALTSLMILVIWLRDGRAMLSLSSALRLPFYVLWKIPIYLKLVGKRQANWTRTHRPGE